MSRQCVEVPLPDLQRVQVLCTSYVQEFVGDDERHLMIEVIEAGRVSVTVTVEVSGRPTPSQLRYGTPTLEYSVPEDLGVNGQAGALAACMIVAQRLLDMFRLRAG